MKTRSWIKLRFSLTTRGEKGKNGGEDGGSWWGGGFRGERLQWSLGVKCCATYRWFLSTLHGCDGSGGSRCGSPQLPCLNFFILHEKSETDVSFMRTPSFRRRHFIITSVHLAVCFQLFLWKTAKKKQTGLSLNICTTVVHLLRTRRHGTEPQQCVKGEWMFVQSTTGY